MAKVKRQGTTLSKTSAVFSKIAFVALFIVLVLYAISLLTLIFWAVMASLKSRINFSEDPLGLPTKWMFSNYAEVFKNFRVEIAFGVYVEFPELILNTLLYAVGGAFFNTAIICVMSYAVAKFPYKFSKIIYGIVIITMILPIVGSLPSEIRVARAMGLYDTIFGMWIMKTSFLGLYFLVFYATFKVLPNDFSEAAYVDGATNLRVFLSVILPLVRNTFFTIMLIKFIELWNDYQIPMLYMPSYPTLSYGSYLFERGTVTEMTSAPMKLAGSMLVLLPIMVLFLAFHKRLIGNITMGGIKE